jgi:hypothetical protein
LSINGTAIPISIRTADAPRGAVALGDSVLAAPSAGFVRGYQLGKNLLVFVLNDRPDRRAIGFRSDLGLWLPSTTAYEVTMYDQEGRTVERGRHSGAQHVFLTHELAPAEMAVFEDHAVN